MGIENWREFVGAARITGSTLAVVWSTGAFAVSRTGGVAAGGYTLTLGDGYAIDNAEMDAEFQPMKAMAASQLCSFGIASTSDSIKTVTALQEGAAGAVSALTDIDDFIVRLYKIKPRP